MEQLQPSSGSRGQRIKNVPSCKTGHLEESSQLRLYKSRWKCCASPAGCGESHGATVPPVWGGKSLGRRKIPEHWSSSPRERDLPGSFSQTSAENAKHNTRLNAARLPKAKFNFCCICSPNRGEERWLFSHCCRWDADIYPCTLAQRTQDLYFRDSASICSQHTGSRELFSPARTFWQNHSFYGAIFIGDQMNPVYSSISTDQPTVLVPFYFCQKTGRKKKKGEESLETREGEQRGRKTPRKWKTHRKTLLQFWFVLQFRTRI